jgi:C-terminal processing protease CtpA/Prc
VVTEIAPDGPAFQRKEIILGDVLVQVNGNILGGMTLDQVWAFIIGPPNTRIDLQLPNTRIDLQLQTND